MIAQSAARREAWSIATFVALMCAHCASAPLGWDAAISADSPPVDDLQDVSTMGDSLDTNVLQDVIESLNVRDANDATDATDSSDVMSVMEVTDAADGLDAPGTTDAVDPTDAGAADAADVAVDVAPDEITDALGDAPADASSLFPCAWFHCNISTQVCYMPSPSWDYEPACANLGPCASAGDVCACLSTYVCGRLGILECDTTAGGYTVVCGP